MSYGRLAISVPGQVIRRAVRPLSKPGDKVDGSRAGRWVSALGQWAKSLWRWCATRWSLWWVGLVRGVRKARDTRRRVLVVVLTVALVATGSTVVFAGAPLSFSGLADWVQSLFAPKSTSPAGPTPPQVATARTPDTTTGELGLENFYRYSGRASGTGSLTMVNLHTGNAIFTYDAFANPSRGHSTSVQITYNSLERDDSSMGLGWSLSATALTRLGSPLAFHPPGQSWPSDVTLVDGDGTSHVFKLDKHGSKDPGKWDYDHPAGVHLFLQKNGGTDATRSWVMTGPDRTRFFFDASGYQTAIADRNGNELRFAYAVRKSQKKPTKFLQTITDPAGRRTLAVTYFAKGDTYTFIDDSGNPVTQDGLTNPHIIDRVKSITDVDGRRIESLYTDKGLLGRLVDGAGTALAKTYRFGYNVAQATPNTRLVTATDPRGNPTRLSYFDAPTNPKFKGWARSISDRLGAVTTFEYVDPDGPQGATLRTRVTDPLSHATRYVLDGRGRPTTVTDAKGQATQLGWDADNSLVQRREPNGALATATYDPNTGYPVERADAEANAHQTPPTKFTYLTALGGHVADLQTRTSPQGRTWTFGYDGRGNLTSATDPAGTASPAVGDFTTSYVYDSLGQLQSKTDANGHRTGYGDYDPTGAPRTVTDALNHTTSVAYDARGHVVSVTDARGKTSTFGFDLFGRPLESRVPKNAAAGDYIVTPAPVYDANDNVTVSTAPNGARTTASYDGVDQLAAVFAPNDTPNGPDRKTSYTYDKVGNVLSVTQPRGHLTQGDPNDFVTRYTYDEIYQAATTTDARGGVTTYSYDNVGNLTKTVDPNKNATADPNDFTTKFTYELNHRPRTTTDAVGFTASVDYDRDGLPIDTIDEEGNKTLLSYDARGMLKESKAPHDTADDGTIFYHTTQYDYDQVGNRTRVISPRGVDTTDDPDDFAQVTVYDELNRVKEQILPWDRDDLTIKQPTDKIINTYDEVGNLTKVSRPPSGGILSTTPKVRADTTYTHFDNGWVKTSTDPFGVVDTYDYDALGAQSHRITTSNDGALSRDITWTYYPDGKLQTKDDQGFPANFTPDTEFHRYAYTYDPNGNLTDLHDTSDIVWTGHYVMTYNQVNQLATMREQLTQGGSHNSTYDYYPNGTLKKRTYDSAADSFEYDPVDQVSKVTNDSPGNPNPDVTTYTYTPRGQVKLETRGAGNTIDHTYYADGLLRHLIQKALDQSTVAEHTLTYDANGNEDTDAARLMSADQHDNLIHREFVYTHDPRDRVRTVHDEFVEEGYAYDANNNVIAQSLADHTIAGHEDILSDYDRNRLVQSVDDKRDPNSGATHTASTYSYDTLGRLKTQGPGMFEICPG